MPDSQLVVSLVVTAFCEFVRILLFRIIDIICVILDGLVVVRGLVCRLAKEVSGVWFRFVCMCLSGEGAT